MVICGGEHAIDLEELAAAETPRSHRVWHHIGWLPWPVKVDGQQKLHSNKLPLRQAYTFWGTPIGFWITILTVSVQSICWLALLISVAGIKTRTWYLLGVGLFGMFQNVLVAGVARGSEKRCLPLKLADVITTTKVMDALMDLKTTHPGFGRPLLNEFFPGSIRKNERDWWDMREYLQQHPLEQEKGNQLTEYDRERMENGTRTPPRTSMPNYKNSRLSLLSLSAPETAPRSDTFGSKSTPAAMPYNSYHYQSQFTSSQSSISQASQAGDHSRVMPLPNRSRPASEKRTSRTMSPSRMVPTIEESVNIVETSDIKRIGDLPGDGVSKHDFESPTGAGPSRRQTQTAEQTSNDTTNKRRRRPLSIDDVYSITRSPEWA